MKPYIHNPNIYRHHYRSQVGTGLPGFSGNRMHRIQYGEGLGSILSSLARKAIPILASGVKLAAPHVKHALKGIAKDVTHEVTQKAANKFFNTSKPKRKRSSKRKNVKAFTSKDIFT